MSKRHKIDKSALPFGTPERIRDRKYLDSFKDKPCMICGSVGDTVAAHINYQNFARGLKAGDNRTAPLYFKHHTEHDQHGDSPDWWMKNYVFPILDGLYRAHKNG